MEMKNLYTSLFIIVVILFAVVFYIHPRFQGFAIRNDVFNLEVEIPSVYNIVEQGTEIHFTTKIFNLAGKNRMDVSLKYDLLNDVGEAIVSKTETMAIETQASFVGGLKIPDDAKEGDYSLHVTLLVKDVEEANSKASLRVMKKEDKAMYYIYIIIISVISLVLIIYLATRSKVILEKFKMKSKIHKMIKRRMNN